MSAATNSSTVHTNSEDNSKTTPERPQIAPLINERSDKNEKSYDPNSTEVKTEPPDIVGRAERGEVQITTGSAQSHKSAVAENLTQVSEVTKELLLDVNELSVKSELGIEEANAIDYGMPLAKTPAKNSNTAATQSFDMETTRFSATYDTMEADNANAMHTATNGCKTSAKSDLDAYLDGIETPIAPVRPRLRVKTEFDLIAPRAQNETAAENEMVDSSPPPPPSLSSTALTDCLADGIATPRISLAAINRLKVKSEFSMTSDATEHYDEEDSAANNSFDITDYSRESGEVSQSSSEADSEDEIIPADYFDDLLCDKLKERIEEARNCELEEKFSVRLKELERLENKLKQLEDKTKDKHKNRKKQKKSKKKSRKRPRSRSMSPSDRSKDKNYDKIKRNRQSPTAHKEIPSSSISNFNNATSVDEDCLSVDNSIQIKREFSNSEYLTKDVCSDFVEDVEEIEEVLTPQQKNERAIKRATALLQHLKNSATFSSSDSNSAIFSTFPFVSTVRKLPTSHSYVQQQIYENRSPLHTVNNVSYKFNSHTTRFNMQEWGLAALPTHAAKVAKLVGCNAQFIHTKLKTIKIPAKLKKVKQEPTATGNNELVDDEEELLETNSSLCCNAMTQTDELEEYGMRRKERGYEIGVQVEPSMYSIGCQTLETQSPTQDLHKDDEAPIMRIIRDLNENQLMALHQFAELIKSPNANANAMEMYKIQMQIVEIYKISQIPSALEAPQTHTVNNYTTKSAAAPQHRGPGGGRAHQHRDYVREEQQLLQQPIIQSVRGADGKQFAVNDPRSRSAAYAQRANVNDGGAGSSSSSNYDPKYSACVQPAAEGRHYSSSSSNPTSTRQRSYPFANQAPPSATTKFYGRGGLRR